MKQLFFYLEITNKTNQKRLIQFYYEELSGAPLTLPYYYEIFKKSTGKSIYIQPHWAKHILSEPIASFSRILEIDPKETFREKFYWDPKVLQLNWLQRLFFRHAGWYRVEIKLNFHPEYKKSMRTWDNFKKVEFDFERVK